MKRKKIQDKKKVLFSFLALALTAAIMLTGTFAWQSISQEALNEIGESEKAHQVLNRVRERAFGDSSENYEGLSKDAFRAAVLQERYLEFPIEGHRWFDLTRMCTPQEFVDIIKAAKPDATPQLYHVKFPIPQRERDLSQGQITQNEGYNQ